VTARGGLILALALWCVPGVAHVSAQPQPAQDPAAQPSPDAGQEPQKFSEHIVVTATRVEQPDSTVPVEVVVLTSAEIERSSAQTVDELLLQVAGFSQLHQTDSHVSAPSTRTASLRGLGGGNSRTLVLVDGVPANDPFGGVVYWSRIPLGSIERIEIIKSGASGVWGNLALGGVIHIITKSGDAAGPTLRASGEAGTYGTGRVSAGVQGRRDRWSAGATAEYFDSDGYLVVPGSIAGPVDRPVGDTTQALTGRVDFRQSSNARWTMGGGYYHERLNNGSPLNLLTVDISSVNGRGVITTRGGSRWQIAAFGTHQNGHTVGTNIAADRQSETLSSDQFNVPGSAAGASLQWSRPLTARQVISVGGDAQWVRTTLFENTSFSSGRFTRDRQAGSHQLFEGLYAQDLLAMNPRWHIVAAARVDRWHVSDGSRREIDIATGNVVRDDQYADRNVTTLDPSLGTVVKASARVSLRGSVYRGFRAPTANEMYRPFRSRGNVLTESNALLDPERLTGTEGGVDISAGRGVVIRVTAFLDELEDAITTRTIADAGSSTRTIQPCGTVPAGGSCRQRANVGQLRSRGVDTEVTYRPRADWHVGLDYLYDPSVVVKNPSQPALVGLYNKQSPVHQVVFNAAYDNPRRATVSVLVRHVGDSFDDDLNTLTLNAFSTVDLRVARRLASGAEVYLSIRNVSNEVIEATKAADGSIGLGTPRLINVGLNVRF
jgi:outer membrane cobalamin receptor